MVTNTQTNAGSRPFPWLCSTCGQNTVVPATVHHVATVRHDGRLHTLDIPELNLFRCSACGAEIHNTTVDDQISDALRTQLRLLTPAQIRNGISGLGVRIQDLAEQLGVEDALIQSWLSGERIQSCVADRLLRAYFGSPATRDALLAATIDLDFGSRPVAADVPLNTGG